MDTTLLHWNIEHLEIWRPPPLFITPLMIYALLSCHSLTICAMLSYLHGISAVEHDEYLQNSLITMLSNKEAIYDVVRSEALGKWLRSQV